MCVHMKELSDYHNLTRIKNGTIFFLSPLFIFFFLLLLGCSISRVTLLKIDNPGKLVVEMYRFIKWNLRYVLPRIITISININKKNKSWKTFRIIIRVKINWENKFWNFRIYFLWTTSTKGKLLYPRWMY